MVKKRQQDFPKTHLRPGRPVGRKKNITPTSFKAKKIVLPKKQMQLKSDRSIQDCLKTIRDSNIVTQRVSNLEELHSMIRNQPKQLILHISEILESVFKIILDLDEKLRNAAVKVIVAILEATDDLQIHTFIPHLINVLGCAMTHSSNRIKNSSIVLLSNMLRTHPDLICHSMTILIDLLQMLTESPREPPRKIRESSVYITKHPILPAISQNEYAQDNTYSFKYRINILGHINAFLKETLKNKTSVEDYDRDEQEVYWDSKGPLNLQIYAGSGLKPMDIEKSYSNNIDHEDAYFDNSGNIEAFITGIVELLPVIFIEEIASESKSDDNMFVRDTIKHLSIIFQVLSSVAEWANLISYDKVDEDIKKFLETNIYDKRRFPFHATSNFSSDAQYLPCVQLNLSICYLFAKFLVQPGKDNDDYNDYIFGYVKRVLSKNEKVMNLSVKYESIPILVKIIKIYIFMRERPEVSKFLQNSLSNLCAFFMKNNRNRPHIKQLIALFTEMSLDSSYHFLIDTEAMKNWFKWLLDELTNMCGTNDIDKKFLKVIKKIAYRKYPCFLQLLASADFTVIKRLLLHENEDVRDTASFLIYNMREIGDSTLQEIAHIILTEESFPKKSAIRLIRLITYRFTQKPEDEEVSETSVYDDKGFVNICLFLLNIALDVLNIDNEDFIDIGANKYKDVLLPLKDTHIFNIYPSLQWKEHSELFDVCVRCLRLLPKEKVNFMITQVLTEILNTKSNLPMHCVLAMLKLDNWGPENKYYAMHMHSLIFCCLLTTSAVTSEASDDEWYKNNVTELVNSIDINDRRIVKNFIEQLDDERYCPEGIVVYYILKVFKVFLSRRTLMRDDRTVVWSTIESLKNKSPDKKIIEQQKLYHDLYEIFYF